MNIVFGTYNYIRAPLVSAKGGLLYFLKSLRQHNGICQVVLFSEKQNITTEMRELCQKYHAEIEIYTPEDKVKLMFYRFQLYYDYLEKHKYIGYDQVLLSDMNDVFFQDDPFAIKYNEELYASSEGFKFNRPNRHTECNVQWLQGYYENDDKEEIVKKFGSGEIVCAGTILGKLSGIMDFLEFYINEQCRYNYSVNDQALYNVYVHTKSSKDIAVIHPNDSRIGPLNSLNTPGSFRGAKVLNKRGVPYAIIHLNGSFAFGKVELVNHFKENVDKK